MYLERLQIKNYGPLQNLDVTLPFDDSANPKPVLLVGKNGSGKTLALSHIVNGMVMAKNSIYDEARELNRGKVFKVRSNAYISTNSEFYYSQCYFESDFYVRELFLKKPKYMYDQPPNGLDSCGFNAWDAEFGDSGAEHFDSNFNEDSRRKELKKIVSANSMLYFPANRADEPAWLNEDNLLVKPQYTEDFYSWGGTPRRVITYSPLQDIHNWLYDVAFDRMAFEISTHPIKTGADQSNNSEILIFVGYQGDATNIYESVLKVLRTTMPNLVAKENIRFGIGRRHNRRISLMSNNDAVLPNIFQLSSGEMALLALFLSILRDYDLREDHTKDFYSAADVTGLVVVDEVELHLHTQHQYQILPNLIKMFPKVQFILTTHSPLFIQGMSENFGINGFEVYDLPNGFRIHPEDFSEFKQVVKAMENTATLLDWVKAIVEKSHKPTLFVEGDTDRDYLQHAAKLLEKNDLVKKFNLQVAGGKGNLNNIWKNRSSISMILECTEQIVVLLHDPESEVDANNNKNVYKRKMPYSEKHPIDKGIENLFKCETLEKIREQNTKFFDIVSAHSEQIRGEQKEVKEKWTINKNEKRSLCDWLCKNGTREDFSHFEHIFSTLEEHIRTF